MTVSARYLFLAAIAVLGLTACGLRPSGQEKAAAAGMANPASVYCISQSGRLDIRKTADGGEYGICRLPDGTEIDEWTLYRRDHPLR